MWFKLIDACTSPVSIRLPLEKKHGRVYEYVTLNPGKEYEYPDEIKDILLGYTVQQKYTMDRETELSKCGARYEVKLCKVCGGKRQNIIYHPIEEC